MARYKLGPDYINPYDWKKSGKRGWQYEYDALIDRDWIADRRKLFAESGNGWWRLKGTPEYRKHMNRIKEENGNQRDWI